MKLILTVVLAILLGVSGQSDDPQAILEDIVSGYASDDDPALVVQVSAPDGVWSAAAGMANDERAAVVEDRFRIGSMSKTFVAVTTLLLVEDGVFELDDSAANWLPQEVVDNIANVDRVTIRQLLSMRSGIEDYLGMDDFWAEVAYDPTYEWTELDVLLFVYGLDPLFEPDEDYSYSNTNYILMELVLEEASGQPLHTLIRDLILEPLNMENTYTQVTESLPGGFVNGYSDFDGDGIPENVSNINDGAGLADGGLISNVGDLTTFYQALCREQSLLSDESMAELLDFQPVDDSEGYSLGLNGWFGDDFEFWGHEGGVLGFLSIGVCVPEEQVTIIVLSASEDVDPFEVVLDIFDATE
ncbi:MAG: beta-lactamase family protein [Chloroflexi bacterium]|nr:beta-lactamase family protein [Chloroflexota bacterium]